MADGHTYWNWRDEMMKHPAGRATGGEPCAKCGTPIPADAFWKHRDRHVCSPNCNNNMNRQFNRLWRRAAKSGESETWAGRAVSAPPPPRPNPRESGPRVFGMTDDPGEPYEWEGYCPLPGDVVERFGVETTYSNISLYPRVEEGYMLTGSLYVARTSSGHRDVWAADSRGELRSLHWGQIGPDGEQWTEATFDVAGVLCCWSFEFISDVTPHGFEYRWEAPVAVPVSAEHQRSLWSLAYKANSDRKKRVSANTARHARRVRAAAGVAERFDPVDIYERDGWVCRLCGQGVDRDLAWPEARSASLDHRIPLAAYGAHSAENSQLAHLICNIIKGARSLT